MTYLTEQEIWASVHDEANNRICTSVGVVNTASNTGGLSAQEILNNVYDSANNRLTAN
uniref:Uncharacterized protein n=1 Tax=viral metagenome TaxID=1070528 RepID=A0A6H2A246_9ZZZZ